jgi:cytidylate kinase
LASRPVIVAVDGPAGSGKSSVCARLAQRLDWTYVNTGAIYRAVGLLISEQDVDLHNEAELMQAMDRFVRDLVWNEKNGSIWCGDRDLSEDVRTPTASKWASMIAKMPVVRTMLLDVQRRLALQASKGAIVDGRDIGTVIFPDAELKIFLTASLEERARRRHAELCRAKVDESPVVERIQEDIARRDEQDSSRISAPMKMAEDAVQVDTTSLALDDVVDHLHTLLRQRKLI